VHCPDPGNHVGEVEGYLRRVTVQLTSAFS
jgi:hypothetical protein